MSFNFRKFQGQFVIKMDYSGGTKSSRHSSSHHLTGYHSSNHHSSSQHSGHHRPSSSMSRRSFSPRSSKYGKQMLQCYFENCGQFLSQGNCFANRLCSCNKLTRLCSCNKLWQLIDLYVAQRSHEIRINSLCLSGNSFLGNVSTKMDQNFF